MAVVVRAPKVKREYGEERGMTDAEAVNDYLGRLDHSLGAVSAGDRAEIILEVRRHLQEARQNNQAVSWASLLSNFGEPEQVANRYLIERGLKMQRASKNSALKWIVIGILGAFAFMIGLVIIVLVSFMPIIKIDEGTGRLQILGGAVDIQAKDVITKLSKDGSFVFGNMGGAEKLTAVNEKAYIKFGTGELRIDYNGTDELNWDCDGAGKRSTITSVGDTLTVDLSAAFVDCDLSIPSALKKVSIEGNNGSVEIRNPQQELNVKLTTGNVSIAPDPDLNYNYTMKTGLGEVDASFVSKDEKKAIPVVVEVGQGEIERLD